MGLVDKIKQDVKRSGQNKGKFIYFREGQKIRVRFLTDMDDGMEVTFMIALRPESMFLVRSFSERIVLIVMMTVFALVLSISGLYGIMRPRKFSCSCSL